MLILNELKLLSRICNNNFQKNGCDCLKFEALRFLQRAFWGEVFIVLGEFRSHFTPQPPSKKDCDL